MTDVKEIKNKNKNKELTEEERQKILEKIKKLGKDNETADKIAKNASKMGMALSIGAVSANKIKSLVNGTVSGVPDVQSIAVLPNIVKTIKSVASHASNFSTESIKKELEEEKKLEKKLAENKDDDKEVGKDSKSSKDSKDKGKNTLLKSVEKVAGKVASGVTKGISAAYMTAVLTGLNPAKKIVDAIRAAKGFSEGDMNDFEISFNVDKFLTEDFSASPSKHRFAKAYAKNILPGAMIMLGVSGKLGGIGPVGNLASKLMAAKVMSVYSTPDGRLSLELLPVTDPKKDGQLSSGLRVALTEQVSPNEVLTIQNPYGRGMGAATPAYYSESQFAKDIDDAAMFSELVDSYETYSETMDDAHVMKEIHEDLLHIGMSEAQVNELLEDFSKKYDKKRRKAEERELELQTRELEKYGYAPRIGVADKYGLGDANRAYNYQRWGIKASDKPMTRISDVGAIPYLRAKAMKNAYGPDWASHLEEKKFKKDIQKVIGQIGNMINNNTNGKKELLNKKIQNNLELIKQLPDGPKKDALMKQLMLSIK